MIITIDGPVGTGKSTIAKLLAKKMGFVYFDTGAMYRCMTYALLKARIDYRHPSELLPFLSTFSFDIRIDNDEKHYFYEGEEITSEIRRQKVTGHVSEISAIPEVRHKLIEMQRLMIRGLDAVVEGRDMGTVVFPTAELKIFLTGRPEVRAKRRFEEMKSKHPDEAQTLSFDELLKQINQRDHLDSTRTLSPLQQAKDAFIIDTSDLTIEEVINRILKYRHTLI